MISRATPGKLRLFFGSLKLSLQLWQFEQDLNNVLLVKVVLAVENWTGD
jgi:hypothetical protein